MPAGRPTKYSKAMQTAADEYTDGGFAVCGDVVPSRSGLAVHLGVTRATLENWSEEHEQFLATLERLKYLQERLAINGGLKGDFNATICKLLLANHGYSERQHFDHTTSDGSMRPPQAIMTTDPIEAAKQYQRIMGGDD